ncbi:nucleotidyltransferase domain-containing protein [Agromyces sp. SYSU K20354]|uniref:nucleotidyltransferase domain-containing protein n=1 Tax=Agromyces cavernae TaxID=2898659 RepID=UPI001E2F06E6|nr:nucleotidyltransferase domain-containing protein [Agromyces cavernae]MCD2443468.1 nucleotidyltransferase domain-containing protein [Agromyces cavernae]
MVYDCVRWFTTVYTGLRPSVGAFMDLREPLASLMSPVEAASLRVLARSSTEFTGRQVANLATTGTAAGIRKALLRLGSTGLVNVRAEPHATYYSANAGHVLWPVVEQALSIRQVVEQRMVDAAREIARPGMTIAVFGSYARDEAGPESDIDFVFVFPPQLSERERDDLITEYTHRVTQWTGNATSVYDTTPEDIQRLVDAQDPIIDSWLRDARTLAGPGLNELVSR